ncbi:hypothetical protein L204_103751 [Cryptococcus depauperatus]|nr:kelch repeat-containing protein [Cryptococcus depauperatus CBS 7855]
MDSLVTPNQPNLDPVIYPSHLAQTSPISQSRDPPEGVSAETEVPSIGPGKRKEAQIALGSTSVSTRHLPTIPNVPETPTNIAASSTVDGGNALEESSSRRKRAGTRSERPHLQSNTESKGYRTSSKSASVNSKPLEPRLPASKEVVRAPASLMYFSPMSFYGRPPNQALRAHTGTLVDDRIWVIGGVDKQSCWRGVAWFDTESYMWSTIETQGERFPPLRAHTTTLVGDKLFIFGGGDGPSYSNDVWILDTTTHRFSRPVFKSDMPLPPPRRAHTTVLYRQWLVVFGGGNGQAALNDVWALDISDPTNLSWEEWKTRGDIPQKKGYHTANLIGHKMIVFGGSDGHASFADVHVLDLQTRIWTLVNTYTKHNRLSHTSTQVGSYLFVMGGHNGQSYAQDVLLLNLVNLEWETKIPQGVHPPGRGYHVALLHDARIFISGGYNGDTVFDDFWVLDLSASAYLPQVTTFEVDETAHSVNKSQ